MAQACVAFAAPSNRWGMTKSLIPGWVQCLAALPAVLFGLTPHSRVTSVQVIQSSPAANRWTAGSGRRCVRFYLGKQADDSWASCHRRNCGRHHRSGSDGWSSTGWQATRVPTPGLGS